MYARASHPLEYIFTRAKKCTQGRPTPLSTFFTGKKMYSRASHPLEYIFTTAKNVLEGVPPPWVHFYNGKKCTGGRPTPLSTFLQRQKMYWRASHPLEYIFTRTKNVLEGVPPPWVHFYKGKKNVLKGVPPPWVHFYIPKPKKCNRTRGTTLSTFSLLALRQKNVLKGVGGPWVHFYIAKKKNVLKGVGRPWVHFLYSSPGKKMYWRGWDPLQYIFKKKCTGIRGTYFGSIFLGGGFWAKKNVLKGVGGPWLHFFLLFSPPPPLLEPTWGGSQVHFQPSPPPKKKCTLHFCRSPLKIGG